MKCKKGDKVITKYYGPTKVYRRLGTVKHINIDFYEIEFYEEDEYWSGYYYAPEIEPLNKIKLKILLTKH